VHVEPAASLPLTSAVEGRALPGISFGAIQIRPVETVKEKATVRAKVFESDFKNETAIREAVAGLFALS
jgi:hypothetical protein